MSAQREANMYPTAAHQWREAIERRERGETLAHIGRSYNVSAATISRLGT
jgi:hypothetical protein